jgi:hypothetical protein
MVTREFQEKYYDPLYYGSRDDGKKAFRCFLSRENRS